MILIVVASFVLSMGVVRWLAGGAAAHIALDRPNARSLHVRPTPRLGGLGLMVGAALGWMIAGSGAARLVALPVLLLTLVSLADDLGDVPAVVRLLAQGAAGLIFLNAVPAGSLVGAIIVLLALVWSANLFNFMDGSDGLAGGMATIGFAGYAMAAELAGDRDLASAAAALSAAALGFLVWNRHPARIFMGDAGAVPLGFIAAALGVIGIGRGTWGTWLPVLVFSPFLVDASVTLARRALRGERVWQAHRSHYYQRVIQMGLGHARTAHYGWGLMALASASAIATAAGGLSLVATILTGWAILYLALAQRIDRDWTRHQAIEQAREQAREQPKEQAADQAPPSPSSSPRQP